MADDKDVSGFASLLENDDDIVARDHFLIRHLLAHVRTGFHAKVIKVYAGEYGDKDSGSPTLVDVLPVVKQMDAKGNAVSHGVIYGIAVPRLHHGAVGILADPSVGDVGFVTVADRDSSSMLANSGQESAPGSWRRHSMSDGVYWGTVFGKKPATYIDMRGDKITVSTPGDYTHNIGGTTRFSTTGGPTTIDDGEGNKIILDAANKKIKIIPKDADTKVYLGGDPDNGGVFGFVSTDAGPSDNTLAHVSGPV